MNKKECLNESNMDLVNQIFRLKNIIGSYENEFRKIISIIDGESNYTEALERIDQIVTLLIIQKE